MSLNRKAIPISIFLTVIGAQGCVTTPSSSEGLVESPTEMNQSGSSKQKAMPSNIEGWETSIEELLDKSNLHEARSSADSANLWAQTQDLSTKGRAFLLNAQVALAEGHYQIALTQAEYAAEQLRESKGSSELYLADSLLVIGEAALGLVNLDRAENALAEAEQLYSIMTPPKTFRRAKSNSLMAKVYLADGRFSAASALINNVIESIKGQAAQNSKIEAYTLNEALNTKANIYTVTGHYDEAEKAFRDGLSVLEKHSQSGDLHHAMTLTNLGGLLTLKGEYEESLALLQQSLEIRTKLLPDDHILVVETKTGLGVVYGEAGQFETAFELLNQAIEQAEQAGTAGFESLQIACASITTVHTNAGDYTAGQAQGQKALSLAIKLWGMQSHQVAAERVLLAQVLSALGSFQQAEGQYLKALNIEERSLESTTHTYPLALINFASLKWYQGRFEEGLLLSRRAAPLVQEMYGSQHPYNGKLLNNQAAMHRGLYQYPETIELLEKSLEISRQALGDHHPFIAQTLNNLAQCYVEHNRLEAADTLFLQGIDLLESSQNTNQYVVASIKHNLARLRIKQDKLIEATQYIEQAIEELRQLTGDNSPDLAILLQTAGKVYYKSEDYEQAREAVTHSLEILQQHTDKRHQAYIAGELSLGHLDIIDKKFDQADLRFTNTEPLAIQSLGELHPTRLKAIGFQIEGLVSQGDLTRATKRAADALQLGRQAWYLASTSASSSWLWAQQQRLLGPASVLLSLTREEQIDLAFQAAISTKGLILEQEKIRLLAANSDPETRRVFESYFEAATDYSASYREQVPRGLSLEQRGTWYTERRERMEYEWRDVQLLQVELSKLSQEYNQLRARQELSPIQLASHLPVDSLLIDFIIYDHALPSALPNNPHEDHLSAFIVNTDGQVLRVNLGPWKPIQQAINSWRGSFSGEDTQVLTSVRQQQGNHLSALLWEPLASYIDIEDRIYLSPTRELALLPWGALPSQVNGAPLIDNHDLSIIPIPRLMGLGDPIETSSSSREYLGSKALIISAVDYGSSPSDSPSESKVVPRSKLSIQSPYPLRSAGPEGGWKLEPGMAHEGTAIASLFDELQPRVSLLHLTGPHASEANVVKALPGKKWLHVASHGFFSTPDDKNHQDGTWQEGLTLDNPRPMGYPPELRAGIVLAGVNNVQDSNAGDGILSAWELAALDLSSLELAVLAACETADGEVAEGGGVLSLQRALQAAGVNNTVSALWKVNDGAALVLMKQFYTYLLKAGSSPSEALNNAQRWLKSPEGRKALEAQGALLEDSEGEVHPGLWAGWVVAGGL